jgi:hypothetical protein
MLSITKDMLITRVMNEVAAGTTAQSSSVLDMQGYDSVIFVAILGTVTDNSVVTLAVKSNPTSSSSGGTVEKTGTAITAATSSDTVQSVEVQRPTQRYVFAYVTRTAQNAAISAILAIQFNSKNMPVTQTIAASDFAGPNA